MQRQVYVLVSVNQFVIGRWCSLVRDTAASDQIIWAPWLQNRARGSQKFFCLGRTKTIHNGCE